MKQRWWYSVNTIPFRKFSKIIELLTFGTDAQINICMICLQISDVAPLYG